MPGRYHPNDILQKQLSIEQKNKNSKLLSDVEERLQDIINEDSKIAEKSFSNEEK